MKLYIILLFFIGILMIIRGYQNNYKSCKPQIKIVYRYVPRTFAEEQEDRPTINDMFQKMFNRSSVWVDGGRDPYNYISQ